jgi:hypothetical protein
VRVPVSLRHRACCAVGVLLLAGALVGPASALDPPKDEAAFGYNFYDGGGITVQGPAMIVKKQLMNRLSLQAGSRVDMISSASVDVVTQASPYKERRTEYMLGASALHADVATSVNYTQSRESDYASDTVSIGMAHDLLAKNLTLNLRAAHSWDQVGKNGDPAFGWQSFDRTIYAAGLTQSLSPHWLLQLNYEGTADSGFINNPYRSATVQSSPGFFARVPERYPEARTGHAWVLRSAYGLVPDSAGDLTIGQRSSVQIHYRFYQDTFAVQSHTGEVEYQRYLDPEWLAGFSYRYYQQNQASFYGDSVPVNQFYRARDKELSQFSDHWLGGSLKYKPLGFNWHGLENLYVQFSYSFAVYDYDNFTDPRTGDLYSLRAHVLHTSVGFTY